MVVSFLEEHGGNSVKCIVVDKTSASERIVRFNITSVNTVRKIIYYFKIIISG